MAEIRIHREHPLGLAQARKIARRWAEEAQTQFGLACTVLEGEQGDTVQFHRPGVVGEVNVTADRFELVAQLGFLAAAFKQAIEAEIETEIDRLLAASGKSG